jgi:2-dehydro-3-deoxyphosphooctonate aldolase (KDO 8-P synthase)
MAKKPKIFFLVAGPCVLETESGALEIARRLREITDDLGIPFIFKASFDKANRSSAKSYRGPGLREGLAALARIKKKVGCKILTDIHEVSHVAPAAKVADVLQIPAFLCRQTDLILAAGRSRRTVHVKKGQFLSPADVDNIAEKLRTVGCRDYYFTERGTTFGYNNLVVDMRSLAIMRDAGHKIVFDATHSVQRPGALGSKTGGDGWLAPVLARAAVAVGVDGLFIETHPRPEKALSDGPNMIPLSQMRALLAKLQSIHEAAHQ